MEAKLKGQATDRKLFLSQDIYPSHDLRDLRVLMGIAFPLEEGNINTAAGKITQFTDDLAEDKKG